MYGTINHRSAITNPLAIEVINFSQEFLSGTKLNARLSFFRGYFEDPQYFGFFYDLPTILKDGSQDLDYINFCNNGNGLFRVEYQRNVSETINGLLNCADTIQVARRIASEGGQQLNGFAINEYTSVGVQLLTEIRKEDITRVAQLVDRVESELKKLKK